jgi:2-polyprenyl-6-hydroxyphenyl methylase/3-demethylubiquinone-9 3-methyltransferase
MGFPSAAEDRPLRLRAVDPRPAPCKVCGAAAPLFGVQDFNRSCEELRGVFQPLSATPVYYRRCSGCGLIFSDAFDDWSDEDFAAHIYNEAYAVVDPDFLESRPRANAGQVAQVFKGLEGSLDVLDYGGGNGCFAETLAGAGFRAPRTYDRFHPAHRQRPEGRFRLVTCFETIEHMPDPKAGAADIASFLADDGLLILSTLIQPPDILKQRLHWWYAGPRNGHITLFSYPALARLFGDLALRVYPSPSPAVHFICREIPAFAKHLLPNAQPVAP